MASPFYNLEQLVRKHYAAIIEYDIPYPYSWIEPDDHIPAPDIPISRNSPSSSKFIKSGVPCLLRQLNPLILRLTIP